MSGVPDLFLADAEAQEAWGARLAAACPRRALILLQGDLGAGKTTLVRGFLRARGHHGPVRSPTYTLVEPYDLPSGQVYHLDLYRLGHGEELEYLGLRDLLDEEAVLLIEWPERAAGWLPPADLRIRIRHLPAGRQLELVAESPLGAELSELLLHQDVR
jgi:tRNA threonylcarbamoyladenosine biosynthesis protein TsaE